MDALDQNNMGYDTCIQINAPLVVLNIMVNAFYIFSMVCPLHGERIKQPLKLLLWSLICSTWTYLMSLSLLFVLGLLTESNNVIGTVFLLALCSLNASMTASVWLNFFYYTQIVPAQRALFIWIKKNIKFIVYSIWVVERLYILFNFTIGFYISNSIGFNSSSNFTVNYDIFMSQNPNWLEKLSAIMDFMWMGHFLFCLCVMVKSTGSTVVYLSRHMRHMVTNGQTLLCPQLRSQVRVTVTGILQGILYVFCVLWYTYFVISQYFTFLPYDMYTSLTIVNLYMAGTTFNLGAGQAVFRQTAAHIWSRAAQWGKVCKSQI